jgi:hypothetical protein
MRIVIALGAALAVAACTEDPTEQPAVNQPAAAPQKVPHCFFKDSETKEWALKVEGGQAVVTGRAYRSDPRYKAGLLEPEIQGSVAVVRPSISTNDTGFASLDNWWDVTASIPAQGLETIEVRCGKKVLASLKLPKPAR